MVCEKHGIFYKTYCPSCNQELIAEVKASAKAEKQKKNNFNKRVSWQQKGDAKRKSGTSSDRTKERKKLKDKLQGLVATRLKRKFGKTALWFCWQTKKRPMQEKGLFSLHCSHFYPKGTIWQLWSHEHNVFPSSYNENINNQSNVTSARPMLEKVYGKDNIEELDKLAEYYRDRMNKGIENKKPTEMQLIAMIEEMKLK